MAFVTVLAGTLRALGSLCCSKLSRLPALALACALLTALPRAAAGAPALTDVDWIEQPHTWVAARCGVLVAGGVEEPKLASGGPFSLTLGYDRTIPIEVAVGRALERGWELQALYATAPLHLRADSLFWDGAGGGVRLASGTVSMLLVGASWGARHRFVKEWGELGDGGLNVGLLLGLAWSRNLEPTSAARALLIDRIRAHPATLLCLEGRMDQRLHAGLVGSLGLRVGASSSFLRVDPRPGSDFQPTDVPFHPVMLWLGLAYWR